MGNCGETSYRSTPEDHARAAESMLQRIAKQSDEMDMLRSEIQRMEGLLAQANGRIVELETTVKQHKRAIKTAHQILGILE